MVATLEGKGGLNLGNVLYATTGEAEGEAGVGAGVVLVCVGVISGFKSVFVLDGMAGNFFH